MQFEGEILFSDSRADLAHFLRKRLSDLLPRAIQEAGAGNSTHVDSAAKRLRCEPLKLRLDQAIDRVEDTMLTVRDYGRMLEIPGYRASKWIPYVGEQRLWDLRPSNYDSCPPMGIVAGQGLTIAISVRKDETAIVTSELDRMLTSINQYITWQSPQLDEFNEQVEARIQAGIRAHDENEAAKNSLLKQMAKRA